MIVIWISGYFRLFFSCKEKGYSFVIINGFKLTMLVLITNKSDMIIDIICNYST